MASNGTILTRVYISNAQIPIPGATVAFTQKLPDGRYTLLAFASVDIWVEEPGFEMLRIEDVQVFPDRATIQDLELIPLPEQVSPSVRTEIVQITPQNL